MDPWIVIPSICLGVFILIVIYEIMRKEKRRKKYGKFEPDAPKPGDRLTRRQRQMYYAVFLLGIFTCVTIVGYSAFLGFEMTRVKKHGGQLPLIKELEELYQIGGIWSVIFIVTILFLTSLALTVHGSKLLKQDPSQQDLDSSLTNQERIHRFAIAQLLSSFFLMFVYLLVVDQLSFVIVSNDEEVLLYRFPRWIWAIDFFLYGCIIVSWVNYKRKSSNNPLQFFRRFYLLLAVLAPVSLAEMHSTSVIVEDNTFVKQSLFQGTLFSKVAISMPDCEYVKLQKNEKGTQYLTFKSAISGVIEKVKVGRLVSKAIPELEKKLDDLGIHHIGFP